MASFRTVVRVSSRVTFALLGLGVAVLQALDETHRINLDKGDWRWAEFVGLVALGLIAFGDNARALVRTSSEAKRAESRRKVFRDIVTALSEIAASNDVSIMYLGASIFLVRKKLIWDGWRLWRVRRRELLDRWDRIRLSDSPQRSSVRWFKGKGAVGTAWKNRRRCHRDWHSINARWGDREPTPAEFAGISAEAKAGLEYDEFVALLGKYSETLAVPIMNGVGTVVGVLSVDVACTGNVHKILDDRNVEVLLENAIGVVLPELNA